MKLFPDSFNPQNDVKTVYVNFDPPPPDDAFRIAMRVAQMPHHIPGDWHIPDATIITDRQYRVLPEDLRKYFHERKMVGRTMMVYNFADGEAGG